MASSSYASSLSLLILLLISSTVSSSSISQFTAPRRFGERKVGGRTEIKNIESNEEVQDLGRYCVDHYNRRIRQSGSPLLSFSHVVAGERQVVSGIKYYLTIVASDSREEAGDGSQGKRRRMLFDAVVVVKPWMSSSSAREVVSFAPSAGACM